MRMNPERHIGRTETAEDLITESPVIRLAALLDHRDPPWAEGEVPPLGHWLYFLPTDLQSAIGEDGHAVLGGFLPDLGLPRRMWAGSRFQFLAPLAIGSQARRVSRIERVVTKTGRTGEMVFVTVNHEISVGDSLCIREEQDLVYRGAAKDGEAAPAYPNVPDGLDVDVVSTHRPTAVELFRYSALTYNAHRIHYDGEFTRDVEGYAGLLIHGPLVGTRMIDHLLRHRRRARISHFAFRILQPMFLGDTLRLHLREGDGLADLWVGRGENSLAVEGRAKFSA